MGVHIAYVQVVIDVVDESEDDLPVVWATVGWVGITNGFSQCQMRRSLVGEDETLATSLTSTLWLTPMENIINDAIVLRSLGIGNGEGVFTSRDTSLNDIILKSSAMGVICMMSIWFRFDVNCWKHNLTISEHDSNIWDITSIAAGNCSVLMA